MESTDLVTIPKETALQVFSAPNGLDPYLQRVRAEIDAFVPDISTKKGRDQVASIAHKVARSKTYIDGVGKELVAELKEIPKKVDAERKRMRDTLDQWRDEVRRPLTEWEAAEQARKDRHESAIQRIKHLASDIPNLDQDELTACISEVESVTLGDQWEEYEAEAARAKDATLNALKVGLADRIKHDAEQAELAKLRAEAAEREQRERDERIAREAAEKAQREADARAAAEKAKAEAAAKAEREAAERRELDLKLAVERAEREKAEAIAAANKAAADAEARARAEKATPVAVKPGKRPDDRALIATIASAYGVPDSTAVEWLRTINFDAIAA